MNYRVVYDDSIYRHINSSRLSKNKVALPALLPDWVHGGPVVSNEDDEKSRIRENSGGATWMTLYQKLANDIERLIRQGVYRHGDRIPSVRQASRQHRISITTVLHAYVLLESRGLVESRPQSGYFVNLPGSLGKEWKFSEQTGEPAA